MVSISINPSILFFKVVLAVHKFFINFRTNCQFPHSPYSLHILIHNFQETFYKLHWFYSSYLGTFTSLKSESSNLWTCICLHLFSLKSLFLVSHSVIDFCVEILDIVRYIYLGIWYLWCYHKWHNCLFHIKIVTCI